MKRLYNLSGFSVIRKLSLENKFIYLYRYFSLLLTSGFYIIGFTDTSLLYKSIVVGCLSVAALTLNYIYAKYDKVNNLIILMITIEMISNVIILIPTGGFNSPYIWYTLNTVLITTYYLSTKYFYFNLVTYISSLTILSYYIFNDYQRNFMSFLSDKSNLILSYILIILAIKFLMETTKKLHKESENLCLMNNELCEANKMIKESMDQITSLYQSVNNFVNINNKSGLITIITKYTKEITKTPLAFSFINDVKDKYLFETSDEISEDFKNKLYYEVKQNCRSKLSSDEVVTFSINNKEFTMVLIQSSNKSYGILGIENNKESNGIIQGENVNQIHFLASLSAILFERFKTEEMNQLLLISEERNRIADEIHDSVSQRLFFISSKIYSTIKIVDKKNQFEIKNELKLIRESLNISMKELREAIYRYSSQRKGASLFEKNIDSYINEISKLNEAKITYKVVGRQELINYEQKKVIYRILSEGISNAVRHGNCENVNVLLCIEKEGVKLKIEDDGIGFNLKSTLQSANVGLGVKNMYNLVNSLKGSIFINSKINNGTAISVEIPNSSFINREQGEVI